MNPFGPLGGARHGPGSGIHPPAHPAKNPYRYNFRGIEPHGPPAYIAPTTSLATTYPGGQGRWLGNGQR